MGPYSSTRTFTITPVHQQNVGTTGSVSDPAGTGGSYPWGQTFTAGQNNLVALDTRFCTRGHNPHTFVIRAGNVITGQNLVAFTANLPSLGNPTAETHVDIPGGGIALTPGSSYGILVVDGNGSEYLCTTATFSSNYSGGTVVFSGITTDTFSDASFKTYYNPSFVAPSGTAPDLDPGSDSGTSSTDNRTNDTTPTLTGSATAGSTVRIFSNGVEVGSGTADGGGNYSIETSALSDGAKNITRTVDGGSPSPNLVVFIDTTAPSVPTGIDLVATDSGTSSTDNITTDTTLLINGTSDWRADQATAVTVLVDGASKATGNSISGGGNQHFSLTTSTLTEGVKSITATARDLAGNTSAESSALSVTIDLTPPDAPALATPLDNAISTDPTPVFDWDDPAGAARYEIQVDNNSNFGSPEINQPNLSSSTFTPGTDLADGVYSWRVRSSDAAGNASASYSTVRTLIIDSSPPAVPTLTSPADEAQIKDDTPAFDWSDAADAATYEILVDDSGSGFGSPEINTIGLSSSDFTPGTPLAEGTYHWKVRAKDAAGNTGNYSSVRTFTVDTTPPAAPTITATSPGSPSNDSTPDVQGTTGTGSPTQVEVFKSADCSGAATSGGVSTFTGAGIQVSVTANTTTDLSAKTVDAAGNRSDCSNSIAYEHDNVAPQRPSPLSTVPASPAQSTTPAVKGAVGTGSPTQVRVFKSETCGGAVAGTGSTAAFTTGSGITVSVTANETTPLSATAVDAAGNESPCSFSFINYTHDSIAPDAPTIGGTTPTSPSQSANPDVKGTVGGGSPVLIKVFTTSDCSGAATTGTADDFTGAGIDVTVPANQTTSLSAIAVDQAGNESGCSNSIPYENDQLPPQPPGSLVTAPASPAQSTTPAVKGTLGTGSPTEVKIYKQGSCGGSVAATGSASDFTTGSGITVTVTANATTTLSARSFDAAGNSSCSLSSIQYTSDSTNPAVSVTSGPSGLTNNNTPTFGFTAEDGAALVCSIDTGTADFGTCTSSTSHTRGSTLADDSYTFRVKATDAAGNSATATRSFQVDATPPAAPTITATTPASPSSDGSPKVKGTTGAGSPTQVEIFKSADCSGGASATDTVAAFTGTGITVSVTADETTNLSAKTVDAAGNRSDCSNSIPYVEDSTPPTAPTVEAATVPASGSNDNAPKVKGSASLGRR